jgi:hypothetical protein
MANYCEREDVIRWYGGTEDNVRMHFDSQLWGGALTSFTIDGLTFDIPTTILLRIDAAIETASSLLDTKILQAYKARPTSIPGHLRHAAAKIAARDACADDGVLTDRIRRGVEEVKSYFDDIANRRLDLGIVDPRPPYRVPAPMFLPLNSTGSRSRRCGC